MSKTTSPASWCGSWISWNPGIALSDDQTWPWNAGALPATVIAIGCAFEAATFSEACRRDECSDVVGTDSQCRKLVVRASACSQIDRNVRQDKPSSDPRTSFGQN